MRAHVHSDGWVCRYVECRGRVTWADGMDGAGEPERSLLWLVRAAVLEAGCGAGCGALVGIVVVGAIGGVFSLAWALGEVVVRLVGWR